MLKQAEIITNEIQRKRVKFTASRDLMPQIRKVFEIDNVDFGRIDFAVVGGRVRVFEINTAPDLGITREPDHPRYETLRRNMLQIEAGLKAFGKQASAKHSVSVPGPRPRRARIVHLHDIARFNAHQSGKRVAEPGPDRRTGVGAYRDRIACRGWIMLRDTLALLMPDRCGVGTAAKPR